MANRIIVTNPKTVERLMSLCVGPACVCPLNGPSMQRPRECVPARSFRSVSFRRRITCDKCAAAKRWTHLVLELTPAGMAEGGVCVCLSDRHTNTHVPHTDTHCTKCYCTHYIRRHRTVQQHMGAAAQPLGQQLLMLQELTDSIL